MMFSHQSALLSFLLCSERGCCCRLNPCTSGSNSLETAWLKDVHVGVDAHG